ncbi:MAG: RCC1 domain-containing protein [Chloroflexota bacterium]|nr:RCC1 domain-containing protein [Chloroflexota bacterium]
MRVRSVVQTILVTVFLVAVAPLAASSSMAEADHIGGVSYQGLAAAGSDLLCGIRADESLDCWGRSSISVADHPAGPFSGVSAARRAACGLRGDQTMQCWGRWYSDVDHRSRVVAPAGTYSKVDLAEEQACALGTDGRVTCFGRFDEARSLPGVMPIEGTFRDVAAIHDDFGGCGIRTDGTIACWGDDTWGQASPPAGMFTAIAAGRMTLCAIRSSGDLQCWGRGLYGAAEPPPGRYTALAIGGDTGCAISADDESLTCWGADLGLPPDVPAAAVAIGDNIAGMIGTNGVLHTWGETRLWPIWGGWDVAERRDGFGAFRIIGSTSETLELGTAVEIPFTTTSIRPRPEFRLASGSLPAGLVLTLDGHILGTPETPGDYGPITLLADNGKAPVATTTLTLTVTPTQD